jgi:hypothetical protein
MVLEEAGMSLRGASGKRTICEVLREVNDLHQGVSKHDAAVRKLLAEAEGMAKKMSAKLMQYNKKIFKDWWDDNPDYEKDMAARLGEYYKVDK